MPIIKPEQSGVDLSQGRGSAISPADTYYRPPVDPNAGQGLQQLAQALAPLGGKFTQLAEDQAQTQEREDQAKVDFYASKARSEFGSSTVSDVQLGALLPEQSSIVRARVAQKLGADAADEWISQEQEKLLQDPDLRLNPELMDQKLKALNDEAYKRAQGNPFWGAGFAGRVRNLTDQMRANTQSERSKFYEQKQTDQLQQDYEDSIKRNSGPYVPSYASVSPSAQKVLAADPSQLARPIQVARAIIGANEERNAKTISAFIKQGCGANVDPRTTAWCAYTVDAVLGKSGYQTLGSGRAADFKSYGVDASANPGQGDIIVLKPQAKGASGHVGFIVSKNADGSYEVLSGNQNNSVTVTTYRADQVVAIRRPVEGSFNAEAKKAVYGGEPKDFIAKLNYAESNGDPNAQNPASSAGGPAQFIDGTWVGMVRKYRPDLAQGKTDADLIKLKGDTKLSSEMAGRYAEENADTLKRNGVEVNNASLYMAHVLDGKNAAKVYNADDSTPLNQLLSEKQLRANPQLKDKTAGEAKEWAARRMGVPVDQKTSLQNGTRDLDRTYAKTSSLADIRRRDVITKYAFQRALDTGDEAYLNGLPKEYITPEVQSGIDETRRKIADLKYRDYERQRKMEEDKRQDERRQMVDEINRNVAEGKEIDPRKYVGNSEAYNYAYSIQQQERSIPQQDSAIAADRLQADIERGAITNDYSKVLGDGHKSATIEELQDHIRARTDLRTADKLKLLDGLQRSMDVGTTSSSPVVNDFYERRIAGYARGLAQEIIAKGAAAISGLNIEGEAKRFYEEEVHDRVKAYTESNGSVPRGEALRQILKEVEADTEAHLAKRSRAAMGIKEPGTPSNPAVPPSPAAPSAAPPKVQAEKQADGSIKLTPPSAPPAGPSTGLRRPPNVEFKDKPAEQKGWYDSVKEYLFGEDPKPTNGGLPDPMVN